MLLDALNLRSRVAGMVVALALCLFVPALRAQTATENLWIATVPGQWDVAANWSLGHVPYSVETARINGGTVSAETIGCAEILLDSGTLTLNGSLNALTTTVGSGATLVIAGETSHALTGTITNHGVVLWQGGDITGSPSDTTIGHLFNETEGIFDIWCDQSLGHSVTFFNKGTLLKSFGSSEMMGTNISGVFDSTGSIFVGSGRLDITQANIIAGLVNASLGATFRCDAGMIPAHLSPSSLFGGDGTILIAGNVAGTLTGKASLTYLLSGDLTIAPGSTITIGEPNNNVFYLTGTLTNHGIIRWQGGDITGSPWDATVGHLFNESDGTFDIWCDGSIDSSIAFTNHGIFRKSAGTGQTAINNPLPNDGTIEVQTGTLLAFGGINQTAGSTRLTGGTLYCTAPSTIGITGGELSGAGSITGPVQIDGGTLRPGNGINEPLTIYGDLTVTPSGTLAFSTAGAAPGQFRRLVVSGNLSLDGTLIFALGNGFIPASGERFRFLETTQRTGTFGSCSFPSLPANTEYFASYSAGFVDVVVGVTSLADWKALHFGVETDPALIGDNADPDGDGIANLLEYAFGLEPLSPSRTGLPSMTVQPAAPGGPLYLTLAFTTPASVTDLDFTPQVSSDLAAWQSGPGQTELVSDTTTAGIRTVVVRDTVPVSGGARRFMRLQVQMKP